MSTHYTLQISGGELLLVSTEKPMKAVETDGRTAARTQHLFRTTRFCQLPHGDTELFIIFTLRVSCKPIQYFGSDTSMAHSLYFAINIKHNALLNDIMGIISSIGPQCGPDSAVAVATAAAAVAVCHHESIISRS